MIDITLIEKALKLTGKTMEDMEIVLPRTMLPKRFSIEKFCYYLLSPEFIEKYSEKYYKEVYVESYPEKFGEAIYEYQKGNEAPLTNLLSKIKQDIDYWKK